MECLQRRTVVFNVFSINLSNKSHFDFSLPYITKVRVQRLFRRSMFSKSKLYSQSILEVKIFMREDYLLRKTLESICES